VVARWQRAIGYIPQLVYPGIDQPLDLSFTNTTGISLKVTTVIITIDPSTTRAGVVNADCVGPTNFAETRRFSTPLVVPAHATRTLSGLHVAPSLWPRVGMIDLPVNQDACKGTTFTLHYAGTAAKA